MKAAFFFFGQALKSAAANGASDIIVSLLLMKLAGKIKKGEGSTLKNLGASLGLNAAQTIGGNAIRETTDNMIMGEKSHYESQLRRYIQQQGLSREEAEKAVLLDELRATGSIAPFVSGLMLYGASWGMRMLDDVNILRQMHEYVPPEKNFDPDVTPYTQEDFRIAQILQDEAPKKTFEDDSNDGIMGKSEEVPDSESKQYATGDSKSASAPKYTTGTLDDIPDNARTSYSRYEASGWRGNFSGQTPGTNAGRRFINKFSELPTTDPSGNPITYREFDVNNRVQGTQRDSERFVVGSDGSVYYTDSHYGERSSPNGLPPFIKLK